MEDYMGVIKLWACNFEPQDWRFCHGQQLSISENAALYSLLGTTYGGDGVRTFNLPDMRGRFPLGAASSGGKVVALGQIGGSTTSPVTSTAAPATKVAPTTDAAAVAVSNAVAANATVGNATNTLNPYLGLNYIICVRGLYPPRY